MTKDKILTIIGWVLSVITSGLFAFGALAQITLNEMLAGELKAIGYTETPIIIAGFALGIAAILFLIPKTRITLIGAVLMTAVYGGMVATHMIANDGQWWSRVIMVAVLVWGGFYLRDVKFREFIKN